MCIINLNHEVCHLHGKEKYGGYCYKHRHNYLIDHNQLIIREKFTDKSSDYLKADIVRMLSFIHGYNPIKQISNKKNVLFCELSKIMKQMNEYTCKDNLQKITRIQRSYKNRLYKFVRLLRGPGIDDLSKCNNETDFFTYETYSEIDKKYFFSYKDKNEFIWFFDIRSFLKLIEHGQTNPYTRDEIPEIIHQKAFQLSNKLSLHLENDEPMIEYKSRKQRIKQKTIDIFSKIEQFGYECNFEWFLNLRRSELKNLYRNLEDIWNYRLQLTYEMKASIAPPNGLVFTTPVQEVMIMEKQDLQELLLQELLKFDGARTETDKKLGFMYFIIGLGSVSLDCHNAHQGWLLYI